MDFEKLEQELFPHSKIIEVGQDGQLNLIPENLDRIRIYWHEYNSAPSRFLAVTGGSKSGKTLLTNFVIQGLITEKPGKKRGFSWDSISMKFSSLVHSDSKDKAGGGAIYLWPTPFLSTRHEDGGDEEKSLVWIFHIDAGSNAADEITLRPLEQFLLLVCSHLVEILDISNKFRLVSSTDTLLNEGVEIDKLCQSVTYLLRASKESPFYSHCPSLSPDQETTKKTLGNLLKNYELSKFPANPLKFPKESANDFQNATLLAFPNYSGKINGTNGFLCLNALKVLEPYVKNIFRDVTSRVVKAPLKTMRIGGVSQPLNMENMMELFRRAIDKVNCINLAWMEVDNQEEEQFNKPEQQQDRSQNHPLVKKTMKLKQEELKPFLLLLETLILTKIESSLTFSNVANLFQDCIDEASKIPHADAPISQELMEKYGFEIEKLSSITKGFTNEIRRYFVNNYVCFLNDVVLKNFCEKECKDFLKAYNATTSASNSVPLEKLGIKACEKLGRIFQSENAKIVENEQEMGDKMVDNLQEFYKTEMVRFRTDIGGDILNYTFSEQEEHHRKLEIECISLLRECMNFNGKLNEVLPMKEKKLNDYLAYAFQEHSNFLRGEQVKARHALNPTSSHTRSAYENSGRKFENKATYSQAVSQESRSSSKGRPVTLGPVEFHPKNQFHKVTLIFQLTLDDITMGCILKKEGNDGIPFLIARELTLVARAGKDSYILGSDVYTKPVRFWSLGNLLVNYGHIIQQHKNNKASEKCAFYTSLMIGMLLQKLRGKAESKLGKKFSRAIVTFPGHMKRSCHNFSRNILTGAQTYGGFENVRILEENDCLARAFLSTIDKSQCRNRGLLVLSQNSEFLDVLCHYFDGELRVMKREGIIVNQMESRWYEKLFWKKVTIEKCLKDIHCIHKHDNAIVAAVVGSGSLYPDVYVEKLLDLNYFPAVYYFEDSTLAVIIGAVLALTDEENYDNAKMMNDKREQLNVASSSFADCVTQTLHKKVVNVPVSQVGASSSNQENVSQYVSATPKQKEEEIEISPDLRNEKQLLLDLCQQIQSRIENIQFQSELAKKVLLKKVTEGRKLAQERSSSDNNNMLKLVKIQIGTLNELAVRHKLFGKE